MINWRMPIAGLIPPRSSLSLRLPIPIDPSREAPYILTATTNHNVGVSKFDATAVTISNSGGQLAPYLLVIVPTVALKLVHSDWKALIAQLKARFLGGQV